MAKFVFRTALFRFGVVLLGTLVGATSTYADCEKEWHPGCPGRAKAALLEAVFPAPSPSEAPSAKTSVSIHFGNESNPADGPFGPKTYGISVTHDFKTGASLEGGFTRLHEPGMKTFASDLDEAQLTYVLPERKIGGRSTALSGTLWKNRTVDMYTNVLGVEAQQVRKVGEIPVTFMVGAYGGTATRDEDHGRYVGLQVGASATYRVFQLGISYVSGAIHTPGDAGVFGTGRYRKISGDFSVNVNEGKRLPFTVSLTVDKRYFNFGRNGPVIDPINKVVAVTGLSVNVGDLRNALRKKRTAPAQ